MVIVSDIQLPKTNDGVLKVSDISTEAGGDLSARTTITDPQTSTFVKTDSDGRLNILESSVEGAGSSNSLNSTEYAVKQMGAFDGSAYRVAKCRTDGKLQTEIYGNTSADGSGTSHALHITANGNLLVQNTASVNVIPANNTNSGITNDPANTMAVGLRAREVINDASTEKFLLCDSLGHLAVDILNTANVKFEDISSSLNSGTADDPNNSLAVGIRGRQTIGSASTETFLKCNASGQLETGLIDKEQVNIFNVGANIAAGASLTSATLELKGRGKAHLSIKTGSSDQSAIYQLSGDGTNFYTPTGSSLDPVGTPTADMLIKEVETGARYIRVVYTNTGGSGTNVVSLSKLTYA